MELRRLNIGCFGGGTGLPSLLGGLKTNPWLERERRRHDVRQRRQLGAAARRAWRAAARRRAQVRARARAQRARSPARAALAPADARARAAARAHRRQPAAVDDGAVQRRLPRRRSMVCGRCSDARAASGRSASNRPASAPSTATARASRGEVEVDAGQTRWQRDRAAVARAGGAAA